MLVCRVTVVRGQRRDREKRGREMEKARTVETLCGICDVRDAQVAREHEDAYREMQPRLRGCVSERDLDEGDDGVQSMHRDVEEGYSARMRLAPRPTDGTTHLNTMFRM